jgi:hypothetical protein
MQAGSMIGVAKIEVFSKNEGVEPLGAFGIATMRAVCYRNADPLSTPICR